MILLIQVVLAVPPEMINYRGHITDADRIAVNDSVIIIFKIYNELNGGLNGFLNGCVKV